MEDKPGKRQERRLTDAERALWRAATKDVARKGKEAGTETEAPGDSAAGNGAGNGPGKPRGKGGGASDPAPSAPAGPVTGAAAPSVAPAAQPLDRQTLRRIKRGQMTVEAVLDLHGHTLEQAHRALNAFLAASQATSRRCVLVITGKGTKGEGKIRRAFPHWLETGANVGRVIGLSAALPRDGGEGAYYVYLRRPGRRDG